MLGCYCREQHNSGSKGSAMLGDVQQPRMSWLSRCVAALGILLIQGGGTPQGPPQETHRFTGRIGAQKNNDYINRVNAFI